MPPDDELADRIAQATWADIRRGVSRLYTERREWCGFPMPMPDLNLIVEDRNPHAAKVAEVQAILDRPLPPVSPGEAGWTILNAWRAVHRGVPGHVLILRHADGRRSFDFSPTSARRNNLHLIRSLEVADGWDLESELRAVGRLADLLLPRQFRHYLLTGSFLERSRRSGVAYLFRRLRPTVALSRPSADPNVEVRILACLCLHPIAYYENTFAGAMVPTDDVIAHLVMMRADEHLFWKRANQHRADDVESGI